MSNLCVEDRVLVLGKPCPGTLAFIGNTQFSTGVWFGVILDEPIGRNNGSYGGVQYFKCLKNRGVFVRPCQVTKITMDYDNQISTHNSSRKLPNYLKDVSTPISTKKKCSNSSKTDSLVRVPTRKKYGQFDNRVNTTGSEMSSEEKCVLVNETNASGSYHGGYEVVQYLKYPRNHEHFAKHRQVTKIPNRSNIKSLMQKNSLTCVPTLKSEKTSSKDPLSDSGIQQPEHGTKDSIHNYSLKVADKVYNDSVNIEGISKDMGNYSKFVDSYSPGENKSSKNCFEQLVGTKCFPPELQRHFSKTHQDMADIKDYVTELDEKLRRLKTEKLGKGT